jgi:glycosyltransferase involved in cell wall biosynthesis
VAILASTETYIGTELGYLEPSSYKTKDGIPVTRIPYVTWLPHFLAKKLRIYNRVGKVVKSFTPDIIFIHDCQFISIKEIAGYARKHPNIRIYVDGHTDFINSGKNWLSKNILHKLVYKWCAKKIEPYTRKFYGVLPVRVDFYKDVYGIADEKIELLPLGADHTVVDLSKRDEIRAAIRKELNIRDTDFVIVTGGKIDRRKNIHLLMKAVNDLHVNDMKLIIFGTPTKDMKDEIEELISSPYIKYIGWIESQKTYDYLLAADVAIFPGTHSVLWEQAVGVGLPCVFKRWEGIQHVDLDGNCLFIDDGLSELIGKIMLLYENTDLMSNMKKISLDRGVKDFSYFEIAKKAIES